MSASRRGSCQLTHVIALINVEVGIHVALMSTPDSSGHARPWLFNSQDTFYVVAMYFFPGDWVDDRGLDTKER